MNNKSSMVFRRAPLAAALLVAFGSATAQVSPAVQDLITPDSSVSAGVGGVNNSLDAKRFGQYTDLNKNGQLLLDIEILKRDDDTGTWTEFTGRDLGLDTRELRFSRQKQGDWKFFIDYNEIVRNDPYVIHTGMTGIGTTTPSIVLIAPPAQPAAWATANGIAASNGVAGRDLSLSMQRKGLGLGGDKWITPELQFELNFRQENKTGARLFGRVGIDSSDMLLRPVKGTGNANGGWAILLTPEPIDSSIRTIEGKLNFSRGDLSLSGGYYGSFYSNNEGSLTPIVPTTLNRGLLWNGGAAGSSTLQQLASSAVALPPDNQAHQLYVNGTYALSPTTRANFKLSYTHATQHDSFAGVGLVAAPGAPTDLGGVVNTTLANLGLTMRPMKDLTVNASLRYEDRDDKTPVYVYNVGASAGLNNTTNWPSGSQTRTNAKVEGIYRMAAGLSATAAVDYEHKVTPLPPANTAIFNGQVIFRPKLDEFGINLGLRKMMGENLNGGIGLEYKDRHGDDNGWMTPSGLAGNALIPFDPAQATAPGITGGNRVLPDIYMDRIRTRARGNLDWDATDKLSVQVVAEHGNDDFKRAFPVSITPAQLYPINAGARVITNDSLTLDASYKVSDDWNVNGYWTLSKNRWNVNKASLGDDTHNTSDTYGFTVKGKVNAKVGLGMDLTWSRDTTTFNNVVSTTVTGNIAGFAGQPLPGNYLPDIHYKNTKLNLYGSYAIDKKSLVQVNLIRQIFKTDDWQWGYNGVPFVYSDNTTIDANQNRKLTFLGVAYIYKF